VVLQTLLHLDTAILYMGPETVVGTCFCQWPDWSMYSFGKPSCFHLIKITCVLVQFEIIMWEYWLQNCYSLYIFCMTVKLLLLSMAWLEYIQLWKNFLLPSNKDNLCMGSSWLVTELLQLICILCDNEVILYSYLNRYSACLYLSHVVFIVSTF
jgi:hypothetical protein